MGGAGQLAGQTEGNAKGPAAEAYLVMKQLSRDMVDRSPEIQSWLRQFAEADRTTAIELLLHLKFCTRDTYAEWVMGELAKFAGPCALYAVRRLPGNQIHVWSRQNRFVHRPATARGSEDFVMSIIAQLARQDEQKYLDHPSIQTLRSGRIKQLVFLDDSVGSGDRVASFARRFFQHPSIRSWWSYGKIHLHFLALLRSEEGEKAIIEELPGSDHPSRVYPKSKKVTFHGPLVYSSTWLQHRWGPQWENIRSLCLSTTQIPSNRRNGYGKMMANQVFYHSVPNNIPGVLFVSNARWRPLFPARTFPAWLSTLLDTTPRPRPRRPSGVIPNGTLLSALVLIKRGLTRATGLGRRLSVSSPHLLQILTNGVESGFLTPQFRLTKHGRDVVIRTERVTDLASFDRSLYIPQSWCADPNSIQPPPSLDGG